ncbi:MAG: cob(I)yrinic acid a,c-diamide adenosyltransferase [Spirochaetes bacterium]|nr:cob(I)yrinic acid a,c-diamide adenosyltransferase [Spirochaetota bacterium]
MEKGLVQIYTGNGKGKTTAAVGLALRAAGRNLKVIIVQFLKHPDTGEVMCLTDKIPEIEIHRFNSQTKFIRVMNDEELDKLKKETESGLDLTRKIITENKCDVLILDECMGVVNNGFISVKDFIELIKSRPETMEIVLTGRDADPELVEIADLVTEMTKIKHPYDLGIAARTGIEK